MVHWYGKEVHMNRRSYEKLIAVAAGRKKADVCIRHARILDVFNKNWFDADLLVSDGMIAGFAESGRGSGVVEEDAGGRYLVPGFIDSHMHIESTYLAPPEFSDLVVPCGTTTVIADPHEITNVCGAAGINYMLHASEHVPLSILYMIPSCVPATGYEHSGATMLAKDIAKFYGKKGVLGLGEMMNYVGVVSGTKFVLDKIWDARSRNLPVDGHAPGLSGRPLDAYAASGILTDHECDTPKELQDRVRRGMYVPLRQGSACKNETGLLPGVTKANMDRCLFCTDDRQPKSILEQGHINNNVRIAVASGMAPEDAIAIATINAANCYRLDDRGAIVPGRRADFLILNDLKTFNPQRVFIQGKLVAENGFVFAKAPEYPTDAVRGRVDIGDFSEEKLALHLKSNHVRIVDIIPGGVVTGKGEAFVKVENGCWVHDPAQDILKVAVVERHHGTGNVGLALIGGYGLKHGAIAISVAHDSHNIIVVGDNDHDMAVAVEDLASLGGGMTIVRDGVVAHHMALPIAGLMVDKPAREVASEIKTMHDMAFSVLNVNPKIDPFMTLCFMSLPVIPSYKVTDMGLFDVDAFKFVPVAF